MSRRPSLVTLALGSWLAATAVSQHPLRAFDGVRSGLRRWGLLVPDWRFFAPEPGRWDDHLMVRHTDEDGNPTPWRSVSSYEPRRLRQSVYFPENRIEKALNDTTGVLMTRLAANEGDITALLEYQILRGVAEGHVRAEHAGRPLPSGFQFLLLRDTGYDDSELTLRLVSRFEPLERG